MTDPLTNEKRKTGQCHRRANFSTNPFGFDRPTTINQYLVGYPLPQKKHSTQGFRVKTRLDTKHMTLSQWQGLCLRGYACTEFFAIPYFGFLEGQTSPAIIFVVPVGKTASKGNVSKLLFVNKRGQCRLNGPHHLH